MGLWLASAINNFSLSSGGVVQGRGVLTDHGTLIDRGDAHAGNFAGCGKVARGFSQGKAAGKQRAAGLGIKINMNKTR